MMWEADHAKIHVAAIDSEGKRLTEYARATLRAGLFSGVMTIHIDVHEEAKIRDEGMATQFAIYDHCGHDFKWFSLDKLVEIKKSWSSRTIKFDDLKITIVE